MGGCLASASSVEEAGEVPRSPGCFAFQAHRANGEGPYYLRYDVGAAAGCGRLLQLDGESAASPITRFYLEPSRDNPGLVHIRCCYDNKYWMPRQLPHGSGWVVAGAADEAEEDLSEPTCTLFRAVRVPPLSVRLLHVHLDMYTCVPSSVAEAAILSLLNNGDDGDVTSTFTVHDLSQQFVLPRHLAFRGDNGMYLRIRTIERHAYLQFSGRDVGDEAVANTVDTNDDGTFRVRSNHAGKFWRLSPSWIWADCSGASGGDDTLFRALRLPSGGEGSGLFALQNVGNGYFCKRLTTEGKRSCLNAGTPTITADARLQLEEPVVSREICDVVFDLSQPRIHGRSVHTMATVSEPNGTTSNNTTSKVLTLEYKDTEKRTWGSSVTLKLGVAATTICAGVPVIVGDGTVQVSAEFSGSYPWGSPAEKETTQKVAYEVTVPPNTRVTVTLTATRASCDVPYSYTQRDTLVDGRQVTYHMDDGLYTGVNCFGFKYATSEENIGNDEN